MFVFFLLTYDGAANVMMLVDFQEEVQEFALMIEEEYRSHFLVDNLPVAMSVFHETDDGAYSWCKLLTRTHSKSNRINTLSYSNQMRHCGGGATGQTVKAYETGYPLGHVVDELGKSVSDVDDDGMPTKCP